MATASVRSSASRSSTKRHVSLKQRRVISTRMKQYWAKRHAQAQQTKQLQREQPNGQAAVTPAGYQVTVLAYGDGLEVARHTVGSWGDLADLLYESYGGRAVEEVVVRRRG